MTFPLTVAELKISDRERLRVSLCVHKGEPHVDVRLLAPFGGPANEFAPTKTGITLPLAVLPALRTAMMEAERRGRTAGVKA